MASSTCMLRTEQKHIRCSPSLNRATEVFRFSVLLIRHPPTRR
jgi:hypothetical protein